MRVLTGRELQPTARSGTEDNEASLALGQPGRRGRFRGRDGLGTFPHR